MANKIYWSKTALIGGTADALDSIDGAGLTDGDFAHVVAGGKIYIYKLDEGSGATESSPDVITPDANAGTKRWILAGERTTEVTEYCTTDELSQLHESGVVKADLVKLHDITVEAARINTIGRIKARAYRNAAQSIVAEGTTKVAIDTISFDTEGVVDIANSRIIPNLPGYYIVMGTVRADAVPVGRRVIATIFKNGVLVTFGIHVNQGAAGYSSSSASDLIYMNGTTDYLELRAHNPHSSELALYVGFPYQNYISIVGPF